MKKTHLFVSLVLVALLTACAQSPHGAGVSAGAGKTSVVAQPKLEFIDLENFDRELSESLRAQIPSVDVAVVSGTTATSIPPRLQVWLQAVEAGGGNVKVSPPHSNVNAKNPLLLLSLVSGIWNSIKMTKAVQSHEMHKPAQAYDAEILLKIDDKGERLIDKIVFTQKKAKS